MFEFTTLPKKNIETSLVIIKLDLTWLTWAGKNWFSLGPYLVSGVIFCVNKCSAPEGSQADSALYSSLPFRQYTAYGTPLQLPLLRPAVKQWKANPHVHVAFLLLSGFFFFPGKFKIRGDLSNYTSLKQEGS